MSTLMSGISTALQAVLTHSQVLEITQHNISNASTPGYRRQAAILATGMPSSIVGSDHGYGAGQRGGAVGVEQIKRFNLEFFDGRYRSVSAEAKNWDAQSGILSQLEPIMAETGDSGLLPALDQFWAGWQSLASDPTNLTLRTALLHDGSSLASMFNQRSAQITQLRSDQNGAVSSQVDQINALAGHVAQLNGQISEVLSVGDQPNDLLDKRDLAIDQLAELTGAVSFDQKNGEVLVSINGHALVVGRDTLKLQTRANPIDNNVLDVYWSDNQKLVPASGELKGTLEVRDQVLVDQLTGLNAMASALATQVNNIHKTGFGLNNATGLDFFQGSTAGGIAVNPLLDEASLASSSNTGEPGNNNIAMLIAGLRTNKVLNSGSMTLNDFYSSQISSLAVLTKSARDNSYQHGLITKALGDQRESVSGVSLDEEAANMAQAQKAYQAAARVLNTYDELLDLVINRMGMVGR